MKLKDRVLHILEQNRGERISGTQMADELGVSRNAVWKAVKELQNYGVEISAIKNKGYSIESSDDSLSVQGINAILGKSRFDVHTEKVVTSTNTVLKELAHRGAEEGYVLAAEQQTAGKGRLGRSFYSPAGSGVYLSVILRPKMTASDALFITTSAAVAVARAIETCSDGEISPQIKWVNDIYVHDKKVCGILTEAAVDFEGGGLEYAVLGIGVNINIPDGDFPDEIKSVASSIFGTQKQKNIRNRICAEILRELERLPENYMSPEILDEYRKRSMLIGRQATAHFKDCDKPCRVLDIDDRARLVVEYSDGTQEALSSGEVSVRLEARG